MDNRAGRRDSRPERYVSEVGTDTVPVKLVELQSVGSRKRSSMPLFLVSLVVVGLVAFALGGSMATPPPQPSASTAPVAIASPSTAAASPIASASRAPSRSPRPTIDVTPPPTPAPWAWSRDDLPGNSLYPLGIWQVGSRLLVQLVNWNGPEAGVPLLFGSWTEQEGWQLNVPGSAVVWLAGGTVVDGRLWFLAGVGGVSQNDMTYQLVSTVDGNDWEALGKVKGLDRIDGLAFLRRFNGLWVAGMYHSEGRCCDGGGQAIDIFSSTDGVHWTKAALPELGGTIAELRAATFRGALVVEASVGSFSGFSGALLRSTDGTTWRRIDIPNSSSEDAPTGFACNADRCVVSTARLFCSCPDVTATAFTWAGGDRWSTSDMRVEDSSVDDDSIRSLTAFDGGFIAVAGASGDAIVSSDGEAWTAMRVMPLGVSEAINGIVIRDDAIYAIGETFDSSPAGFWTGSLSALGL